MRFLVALLAMVFSLIACAADEPAGKTYVAGKDYVVLDQPVRTSDPSKIEVAEVFSYHCPHCFHFEPELEAWAKKQPSDVVVVQTHAIWNKQMDEMAHAYYTLQVLGLKEEAHMAIFNAIHVEHKVFHDADDWAEFIAQYGSDKETILKTLNSFGVDSLVKQADARARGYGITGTPEMVVDGKYRISGRLAGGQEEMLDVAEFLVKKERAERKK